MSVYRDGIKEELRVLLQKLAEDRTISLQSIKEVLLENLTEHKINNVYNSRAHDEVLDETDIEDC